MKITKTQLRKIIKEEKATLLNEQGDRIADELLGDFLRDMAQELTDQYDPRDAHRVGSEEEFYDALTIITVEVEDLVRQRLSDLWSGDIRLEMGAPLHEDKSGKGKCPDTGCIKKSGDKWRIVSNKTGKLWPQKYKSRKSAESALDAYHASR